MNTLKWIKHPDGYEYAKYKFGSIIKFNKKYQITYFSTIGLVSKHALNLADAKKKLNEISSLKMKTNNAAKKPAEAKNKSTKTAN